MVCCGSITTSSSKRTTSKSSESMQPLGQLFPSGLFLIATTGRALPCDNMGDSRHTLQSKRLPSGIPQHTNSSALCRKAPDECLIAFSPGDRLFAIAGDSRKPIIRNLSFIAICFVFCLGSSFHIWTNSPYFISHPGAGNSYRQYCA